MYEVVMIRSHYPDSRMEKECKTLTDNGYSVTEIAWDRGRFSSCINPINSKLNRFNIPVSVGSLNVLFLLPFWWLFIIYKLIIIKHYDIIHSADLDSFFPALIIAKLKRKIIIYDIYDFYAEMISFPIFPKLFRKFFSTWDRILMKYANAVIIADDSRIEQIGKNANKKIISIYNSPTNYIDKLSSCEVINSKFTIFFGGCISFDRNIHKVILAIRDFDDVDLLVIGPCPKDYGEELLSLAEGYSNVKLCLTYYPHEIILKHTFNSDLLFSLYDLSVPNNAYSSPNKLFEAMMCGKPIIVNDGTSMAEIVKRNTCGVVIPHADVESIKKTLINLKNNPNYCKLLGDNGRKAYEEIYCWAIMEKKLLNLYKSLLKSI